MITWLNAGAFRQAYLYFPAGLYKIDEQLFITQATTNSWKRIHICGDGQGVSRILTTNAAGVFDIKMLNANHAPVEIHHLSLIADAVSEKAISVTGASSTPSDNASSLFVHDLDILPGEKSFKIGIYGKTLKKPGLKNVWAWIAAKDAQFPGSCGVQMVDVNGYESERVAYKAHSEFGLHLQCAIGTGLPVTIVSGGSVGPDTGLWINGNASSSTVAIDDTHVNNPKRDIFIQNITNGVDIANLESLNMDDGYIDPITGEKPEDRSTIFLHSCNNVRIHDVVFHGGSDAPYNTHRRIVQVNGGISDLTIIDANHFNEPGEYSTWFNTNTSNRTVRYNRFRRTDATDAYPINSNTTITRNYQLNGESGADYLLAKVNNTTGAIDGYLDKQLGTSQQEILDKDISPSYGDMWKITCTNPSTNTYQLKNKQGNNYGATTITATISKKANGNYTVSGTGLPTGDWKVLLAENVTKGFDHSNISVKAEWSKVPFKRPFLFTPIVFAGAISGEPALTPYIKNVTATECDIRLMNSTGGIRSGELGFIAVHKGCYYLFGNQLEASTVNIGPNDGWKTISFKDQNRFDPAAPPCVFAQCLNAQNNSYVQVKEVSATSFKIKLTGSTISRNVDYIAIAPTPLTSNNETRHGFQVGRTGNVSTANTTLPFNMDNRDSSDVGFIGALQSAYGAGVLSRTSLTKKSATVHVDYFTPPTPSTATETAGWMVFENNY